MKQTISFLSILFFISVQLVGQNIVITSVNNQLPGINDNEIIDILSSVAEYNGTTPIELKINLTEGESQTIRGLENRTVTTGNLNIQAYDFISEQALGSKDLVLTGSGSNKYQSLRNMVKTLNQKKSKITSWLKGLDKGELDCTMLDKRIKMLINSSQFSNAYTLANNPSCQDGAFALKESIVAAYQKTSCEQHLRKAEAFVATKEYRKAAQYITRIDPDAYCGEKITDLIEIIKENYQSDIDQSFKFYLEYLKNEERNRIDRTRLYDLILLNNVLDD